MRRTPLQTLVRALIRSPAPCRIFRLRRLALAEDWMLRGVSAPLYVGCVAHVAHTRDHCQAAQGAERATRAVEPSSSLPPRIACDVRVAAQRTAPGRRYCDVLRCHRLHHVCSPDVIMASALLAIVRALDIISYAMYLCLQRRTCLRHWCLHRCNLRGAFLRFLSPRVCRCFGLARIAAVAISGSALLGTARCCAARSRMPPAVSASPACSI